MGEQEIQEKKIQEEFDTDLRSMVDIYRTAKRLGLWAVGILGAVIAVLTIISMLKGFRK